MMKHVPPPQPEPSKPFPRRMIANITSDKELYIVLAVLVICFLIAVLSSSE